MTDPKEILVSIKVASRLVKKLKAVQRQYAEREEKEPTYSALLNTAWDSAAPSVESYTPNQTTPDVISDTLSEFGSLTDEERGNIQALLFLMREGDPSFAGAATGLLKPWFGRRLSEGSKEASSGRDQGSGTPARRGDPKRVKRAG